MATIRRFEDLEIWQLARTVCKKIYAFASKEPVKSDFRLRDQMRGSCGSIMDNIAEGFERGSRLEFISALSIAKGESGELRSQLYRALDNSYIAPEEFSDLCQEIETLAKKINRFITYLNTTNLKGQKFKNRGA